MPGVAVNGKPGKYFNHFRVAGIDLMKYRDEAYNAEKFSSYYSGAAAKKSRYTLTCEALAIEEVSDSVRLDVVFP